MASYGNYVSAFKLCVLLFCNAVVYGEVNGYDNDENSVQHANSPHLSYTWEVEEGKRMFVFDEMLQEDKIENLQTYLTHPFMQRELLHRNLEASLESGATPFHALVNKTEFVNFGVFKSAKYLIEKSLEEKVYLENVYGEFLHSLDPKPPVRRNCEDGSYTATIFVNNDWRHNSYGQMSFYTLSRNPNITGESRLEIAQTVHPKPARMVVWPSCITYCHHPPSVNYFLNLLMLTMQFTTEKSKIKENLNEGEKEKIEFGEFKFTNDNSEREIDYAKHLTRSYFDSKKRGIHVFDGLYTVEELREWRDHLLNVGNPGLSLYDSDALEDHDNVQWVSAFNSSEFIRTPVWKRVKELLVFVSDKDEWYPYDVALNLVRPADHTRIHPDAEHHQHEYTYLLYLTEGVTQNDFGETVWFEQSFKNLDGIHEFTHPGGEEFDPIATVWPKFGRVVIFRNIIEHSARPLSTAHLGTRYSFATKASVTKRAAVIKQMYEAMEYVPGLSDKMKNLNEELQSGEHDEAEHSPLTTETLEDYFTKTTSQVKGAYKNFYAGIVKQLL